MKRKTSKQSRRKPSLKWPTKAEVAKDAADEAKRIGTPLRPFVRIDIGTDAIMDGAMSWLARRTYMPSTISGVTLLIPKAAKRVDMLVTLDRLRKLVDELWRGLMKGDPFALTCMAYDIRKQTVAERREKLAQLKREGGSLDDHPELWDDHRQYAARKTLSEIANVYVLGAGPDKIRGAALVTKHTPKQAEDVVRLARCQSQLAAAAMRSGEQPQKQVEPD